MENSLNIHVRVRPWNVERELPYVQQSNENPFHLGGNSYVSSPRKPAGGSLREVVDVVDHRVLVFDKDHGQSMRGQPGGRRPRDKRYAFDHIFKMQATQEEVFTRTALPLLPGILDGFNATVFAYGATGCGKTHTISGTEADPGVTIRIMRTLFGMIEETKDDFETFIEMSMVEVYNEIIRDLLSEDYPNCPTGGLRLLENEKNRVRIAKVTFKQPTSAEEVMDLVLLGNGRRSTSYTESNSESSRSHAVLQITISRKSKRHDVDLDSEVVNTAVTSATLSIIDLAGSERASATKNLGERMKEGANINKSLFTLASCITALCQRPTASGSKHVPYRNSKLTRLLQFSLGGNCRTVMIVCISPSSRDIEETNNTLLWANRAKEIKTNVSRNTGNASVSAGQYLRTIAELNERIRLLQIQVDSPQNAVPSEYQMKKQKSAREAAKQAEEAVEDGIQLGTGDIVAGARLRSLWDAAEMRKTALTKRVEELQRDGGGGGKEVEKEKELLEGLVRQIDASYQNSKQVQNTVRNESARDKAVKELITTSLNKTFGGDIDGYELENVRLRVQAQGKGMESAVATARELGYREGAQQQADALVKAAGLLGRLIASLQSEATSLADLAKEFGGSTDLDSAADRIRQLGSHTDLSVQTIFGTGTNSPKTLPPLPTTSISSFPTQSRNVFPRDTSISGMAPPVARRASLAPRARLHPGNTSLAIAGPSVPIKSALRKVINADSRPSSPSRSARTGSPARKGVKQHIKGKVAIKSRTPKKKAGILWGDDDGGELVETKEITPRSSGTLLTGEEGAVIEESEYTEEEEDLRPSPPKILTGSPIKANRPTSAISIPRTAMQPLPLPRLALTAPASSTGGSASDAPIPGWKQNRNHGRSNLGSSMPIVAEESENSNSSPDSGPSKQALNQKSSGPPSRMVQPRSPLSTLSQFQAKSSNSPPQLPPPTSNPLPSANSSFFASTLSKPTAASLARMADYRPLDLPGSSSNRRVSGAMRTNRRTSNIGPYQSNNRPNRRMSHAPPPSIAETSMTFSSAGGGISLQQTATSNPLAGGAQRAAGLGMTSNSPKGENRRGSMMPPPMTFASMGGAGSLGRAAGRMSMGGARMGTLSSMSSMGSMRGLMAGNAGNSSIAGVAGGGDISTRVWR